MRPLMCLRSFAIVLPLVVGRAFGAPAPAQGFSLPQALSAPFSNDLTPSPARDRVAWVTDAEGRRNVWVAGAHEPARQVTHYTEDDGQDIDGIAWAPEGDRVAWTRGTGAQGPEHPVANPAELPGPVHQVVAFADLSSGRVHVVAEGHAVLFARDGQSLYFLRHGSVWVAPLQVALPALPQQQPSPNLNHSLISSEDAEPGESAAPQDHAGVHQLLFVRGTASGLRLSPDGTRLLFVSERGDHNLIGVYTIATATLQWIDPGVDLDHDAIWSPDGQSVAFVREVPILSPIADRWLREGAPWSIRVASVATGRGREVWHADPGPGSLFHAAGASDQLIWTADDRLVFPWEKGGWTRLYVLPASAGQAGNPAATLLTPGDFEVQDFVVSGSMLLFSANNGARDPADTDRLHLWSLSLPGDARPVTLTHGSGIETKPSFLSSGGVALMAGSATRPLTPMLLDNNGGMQPFAPMLIPSGFPATAFVTPQQVVFPAADGLPIHGQLFLPPGTAPGIRLPAVVFFHGGSRRQMLLGFHPMQYYAQAYEFNQYLVSRGFAVLSVNYRSGTGYGLDFRQALNYGANGASEYNDVVGAATYLARRSDVDAKRIGAWGGSYGGYLTALALARSSDLYAAGVDLHGVHDWSLELDLWKPTNEPNVDQAAMARRAFAASPLADVDRWKSPVLLIQGDDDRNVLFAQTVRLAAALRARHVSVEVTVLPDEVHDFLLHRNWLQVYDQSQQFLRNKLVAPY